MLLSAEAEVQALAAMAEPPKGAMLLPDNCMPSDHKEKQSHD